MDSTEGPERVIKTLAYFDIFNYPLTAGEIGQFLDQLIDDRLLVQWIGQLIEEKRIFFYHGFYSLQNNPLLAHRRKQGNHSAEKLLLKAARIGRFLYQFPFVRAIGISGSLSKNYADEKSDIDFFIITGANRLWISRTIMHVYKKLTFLGGKQHLHCMNYYIDEEGLLLQDRNIFTAIEIKTLLPVCGKETMQVFFETNKWADEQLPACNYKIQQAADPHPSWLKILAEWILAGRLWNSLETWLFRITRNRWDRKEKKGKRNGKGQTMGLITGKHFSRSNPGSFQEKVLDLYEKKLLSLKQSVCQETVTASSAN